MLIEKTTVIEFDISADRARIMKNFSGAQKIALLAVLDLLVAGDFAAMARAVAEMEPGFADYLSMPVYEVARDILERDVQAKGYAEGYRVSKADAKRMLMRGIPVSPESAAYPKFGVMPVAVVAAAPVPA
jgi:hypothetical protein